ncbi:MAG: peptidoglycan DD-metalloendopeptidase family protein [Thermomicrobiales bacterium]
MATMTILDPSTQVHALPAKASATIKHLGRGTVVALTGASDDRFLEVEAQGTTGWVYYNHLIARVLGSNNVRLRSSPAIAADNILVEGMVTGVRVLPAGDMRNEFLAVRYLDIDGWAHGDFLGEVPSPSPLQGGIVCAKHNSTAIHADPTSASATIKKAPKGAKIRLTGQVMNDFYAAAYAGASGWIHTSHLCAATVEPAVRLRKLATANSLALDELTRSTVVDLTGDFQGGYLSVKRGTTEGWALATLLGPVPAKAVPSLSSIWNGVDRQFAISQPYGPTDFSVNVHPEWYAYGLDYCPDWCATFANGNCPPGHTGLDVTLPYGTEVFTPVEGDVVCAGTNANNCAAFSCGWTAQGEFCEGVPNSGRFELRLANGARLIYGHMSRITVETGQHLKPGDSVGFSGRYNGDHVHVEYRDVNPPCARNIDNVRLLNPCNVLMTNDFCLDPG